MKQDGEQKMKLGAVQDSAQADTGAQSAGKPLDGSQYIDVVEEQLYAERRPTLDAREVHAVQHAGKAGKDSTEKAAGSGARR